MNSINQEGLLTQITIRSFRLILDDIVNIVSKASESSLIYLIDEKEMVNSTHSKAIKFTLYKSQEKLKSGKIYAIFKIFYDPSTHMIEKCSTQLSKSLVDVSPYTDEHFHMQQRNKLLLETKEDLLDCLFSVMCPSLCLIRSIIYISKCCNCMSQPNHLSELNVLPLKDKQNKKKIVFKIQGNNPNKHVILKLTQDCSQFMCYYNGIESTGRLLLKNEIEDKDDDYAKINYDYDSKCSLYIENMFLFDEKEACNAVPRPQTSQALKVILDLLQLDILNEQVNKSLSSDLNIKFLTTSDKLNVKTSFLSEGVPSDIG